MSLPVLRDCYKHHATAGEFRAHMERQRNLAQRAQAQQTCRLARKTPSKPTTTANKLSPVVQIRTSPTIFPLEPA